MLSLFRKEKPEPLPAPLKEWSLENEDGVIRLRMEMKYSSTEFDELKVTGPNIRSWIPVNVPKVVAKTEKLSDAYILESGDGSRLFIFATREAASDYITQRGESRLAHERTVEAHEKAKAEAENELRVTRGKLEALRLKLDSAYDGFREESLGYVKVTEDASILEGRIRELKEKVAKAAPRRELGSAIATQFGCDEIVSKRSLVDAVRSERDSIMRKYRGLPDSSDIQLSRRLIASVKWK